MTINTDTSLDYVYRTQELGDLIWHTVFSALVTAGALALAAITFMVLSPLIRSSPSLLGSGTEVDESFTNIVANTFTLLAPFLAYIACGFKLKAFARDFPGNIEGTITSLPRQQIQRIIVALLLSATIVYIFISMAQFVFQVGPFREQPSLQMTLRETDEGIVVDEIVPEGVAEQAGIEKGDLITGIRRADATLNDLNQAVAEAEFGDIIRLRVVQDGEETQLPIEVASAIEIALMPIIAGLIIALLFAIAAFFWPSGITAYLIMGLLMVPLAVGYVWLIIATFSRRSEGLTPLDAHGNVGGLTLDNWKFLSEDTAANQSIWQITLTTLIIAILMTLLVLFVSSMAGYALSRMKFPGRKAFLSLTLILHGFPAVTLLIAIFFVLRWLGELPLLGDYIGFNTRGGIALVMVAFELPLGIWLMKGFFDNIPWDLERSALIDGASRWRTFWEILIPQIRPGILALGIFAFISGWGAYLIPQTYSVGTKTATLAVYINQLTGDTAPVNWNQVAAVGLYQMLPVFIIFVFAQEYLLNIYAGGTKGTS